MRYDYNSELKFASHRRKRQRSKRIMLIFSFIALVCLVLVLVYNSFILNSNDQREGEAQFLNFQMSEVSDRSAEQSDSLVMTLFGDRNTIVLKGEEYIEAGCHVTDTKNNRNTSDVVTTGSVDVNVPGDYEISYVAQDSEGRKKSAVRHVKVVQTLDGGVAASVPVCMYHYVYDSNNPPADIDNNWISNALLREEVEWTKNEGFYYPSYEELKAFVEGRKTLPEKCIVFTFDDGKPEFLEYGNPIFDDLKVPATSFVICNNEDAAQKVFSHPSEYVQYQSHSYSMHRAGSNVGRGGIIHACSYDEILADQKKAVELLGNSNAYAYPFGDNNETAHRALADAGVECAFTIENRQIKKGDNLMALPRVRINGSYTLEQFKSLVS